MILGSGQVTKIFGKGYITDVILGKSFRVSADSFMQSNHEMAEILYSEAIRLADFRGDEVCIDAYCGTGSTTLSFAGSVQSIMGIEINESAYMDACTNKNLNKVENAEFVLADGDKAVAAYEYCNLHGLWVKEL